MRPSRYRATTSQGPHLDQVRRNMSSTRVSLVSDSATCVHTPRCCMMMPGLKYKARGDRAALLANTSSNRTERRLRRRHQRDASGDLAPRWASSSPSVAPVWSSNCSRAGPAETVSASTGRPGHAHRDTQRRRRQAVKTAARRVYRTDARLRDVRSCMYVTRRQGVSHPSQR